MSRFAATFDVDAPAQGTAFYVSFADLMLLLAVFFVMLLGMSEVKTGIFEQLRTGFTGHSEGTLVALAQNLRTATPSGSGISVRMADDGVRVDLDSAALFATGSAKLRPEALTPLLPVLRQIRATPYTLDIEGHSDDQPLYQLRDGVLMTNWSLSGERASSVAHYLLQLGFPERRLRIIGYAATRPKVSPRGKRGDALRRARAANRRVSILVR